MGFYSNLMQLYLGKRIGPADIMEAVDKGWLVESEASRILATKVAYTLDTAKTFKKRELSYLCQKEISKGVDVVLSDGETHHYSLSSHDQVNLNAKMTNILAGVEELEYHSDGEPCVYYSRDDMFLICAAAQEVVSHSTTYYNCLCQWLDACKTSAQVMAIEYGADIPEEYWSEPWRLRVTPASADMGVESVEDDLPSAPPLTMMTETFSDMQIESEAVGEAAETTTKKKSSKKKA